MRMPTPRKNGTSGRVVPIFIRASRVVLMSAKYSAAGSAVHQRGCGAKEGPAVLQDAIFGSQYVPAPPALEPTQENCVAESVQLLVPSPLGGSASWYSLPVPSVR